MDDKEIRALQDRTDAKLRYADVHLAELKSLGSRSGDDFDRAHQESFLYHLVGVRDAFLAELDGYYQGGLSSSGITLGKLILVFQLACMALQDELLQLAAPQFAFRVRHVLTL